MIPSAPFNHAQEKMPSPGIGPALEPTGGQPDAACGEPPGWQAGLALRFGAGAAGTRLVHNRHQGPLRLLKALRSGDGRRLEAVIVHPPGGLVGGDSLSIDLELDAGARVLATTPGAQKWYGSTATASSFTRLSIGAGAMLEWLPQPAILYDQALARQSLAIGMDPGACCVGWEILIRGRKAMGETLQAGHIDQTLSISVGQALLWQERLHADAGNRLFGSPLGWDGYRIAASVWCCAPAMPKDRLVALRDQWRALMQANGAPPAAAGSARQPHRPQRGGATLAADGLVLAKLLADDGEALMSRSQQLWQAARTAIEGEAGSLPRIWRT